MEYPNHAHIIGTSDPAILADKATNKYYMTSSYFSIAGKNTMRNPGQIVCLVSEDLIHWSDPIVVFDSNGTDYWGKGHPATEMHYINGKYYIVGTASKPGSSCRPMILVADNPLGPFKAIENKPYGPEGWELLDNTVYVDKEGHPWLICSHIWYEVGDGQMVLLPLSDDLGHTIGGPMILFRGSDAIWSDDLVWSKTDGGAVAEAPFLYRAKNGDLIMMWTGRSRTGYAMGYAKSASGEIWGPWEQMERPLYAHDGGHCVLFRRLSDNQLMMSQHVADKGPKMLTIYEMEETDDGHLHIINELTGNWLDTAGGNAMKYRNPSRPIEEPAMTTPGLRGYEGLEAAIKEREAAKKAAQKAAAKKAEKPAKKKED